MLYYGYGMGQLRLASPGLLVDPQLIQVELELKSLMNKSNKLTTERFLYYFNTFLDLLYVAPVR